MRESTIECMLETERYDKTKKIRKVRTEQTESIKQWRDKLDLSVWKGYVKDYRTV